MQMRRMRAYPLFLATLLAATMQGPVRGAEPQGNGARADAAPVQRFEYLSKRRAQRKAEELREAGNEVEIRTERERVIFQTVQLRVFQDWSVAKRVETRLKEMGIDALVINDRFERGYAVSAGAFLTEENVREQQARLRELGFRQMSVVPVRGRLSRYVVLARPAPPGPVAPAPQAPAEEEPTVLVFGEPVEPMPGHPAAAAPPPEERGLIFSVDRLQLEAGWLTDDDQPVDASHYGHASASVQWRPNPQWEVRAGARVDGYRQVGDPEFTETETDYTETFVRYRAENLRVTAGAQTVIWGRVDEIPPTDRLSVVDATRLTLDELPERRRAVPALRLETFHGGWKTDWVWVPEFRAAELPPRESIWSPVDTREGALLGIDGTPLLSTLVRGATFGEEEEGMGGAGVRVSRTGSGYDYAFTLQRARHSLPYYELDPAARATLLATGNPAAALAAASGPTFVARHPLSWVVGGDVGIEALGATWRFEAAYLSDVPVTTTDLRMRTVDGFDWVAGVEFYPGDADARVNLQLAGHHLVDAPAVLDREDAYSFNGSIENVFAHARWRAKLRFSVGLDERDVYVNPEIAYTGWEPHELYLAAHYFDGDEATLGGFHDEHDLITVGWRARY